MLFVLYSIALLIGLSLGLLGAGGAIVAVPAFVYIGHIPPTLASGYALFVVMIATGVASISAVRERSIQWRAFWGFGLTTMLTIFFVRSQLLPAVPHSIQFGSASVARDLILMLAFGCVLLATGVSMMRGPAHMHENEPPHIMRLAILGVGVGVIAGFLGVGGGFLMTPALVLWARLDMRTAVATSLALICVNSAVGVAGDLTTGVAYDWVFVCFFTAISTVGILIGRGLSRRIQAESLRKGYAWLVLVLGLVVIGLEIL